MKKISSLCLMLFTVALIFTSVSCSNDDSIQTKSESSNDDLSSLKGYGPNLPDLYEVKKYVFNRKNGANNLGHVGVAFELRARISGVTYTSFYDGAVEGTNGWFNIPNAYIPAGVNNGGWNFQRSTSAQMFADFKSRQYDRYKFSQNFLIVPIARSNAGNVIIAGFPGRGYNVYGNNCMDAVYQLLNNFSFPGDSGNPTVPSQYFPNNYYDSLSVNGGWSTSRVL